MYLFIEKGWRGISDISKRFSKVKNKYMENYDPTKPSQNIMYLDKNNLYGWGMSGYLPYGGCKWLTQEKIKNFDVNSIKENSWTGYILKVDVEYPEELHELHNDYPLAPEKLAVCHDMLFKKNCRQI